MGISHAVVVFACFQTAEWFPMLHGYFAGLVFHLGTLAFGGFVIGCLKIVAFGLWFATRQSTSDRNHRRAAVAAVCCCCCTYCVACVEHLMTMVNDLVYTDVALQGTDYPEATENVVQVTASNPVAYAS